MRKKVLLLEDNELYRDLLSEILTEFGYQVTAYSDPLQYFNSSEGQSCLRNGHCFDVILTDNNMPGMSGRDLAQRLCELRPSIRCLYISGYTADVIAQRGILDDGAARAREQAQKVLDRARAACGLSRRAGARS